MKGKWLTGVLVLAMAAVTLAGCGAKDETKEKVEQVTLNEVAHSIFYAPQYVAIEEGYFADEGIDLTLITGFGADKVLTAMISGDADIGFMGAEATVYAYLEGTADPVVNFAQLTQRAGNFVVGREKDNSFLLSEIFHRIFLSVFRRAMLSGIQQHILKGRQIKKGHMFQRHNQALRANTSVNLMIAKLGQQQTVTISRKNHFQFFTAR